MKTLLVSFCSILCSFISLAQTQLPDSIFLVDGRTTNCLLTEIRSDKLFFIYNNNQKESIIKNALSKVYIEKFGYIFLAESGFSAEIDELNTYFDSRLKKIRSEGELKNELGRINFTRETEIKKPEIIALNKEDHYQQKYDYLSNQYYQNKWSFGVLYVPYYSGKTYELLRDPYDDDLEFYEYTINSTSLEAQLTYAVMPQLKLTFEAGYSASVFENNYEYHSRYNDPNYPSYIDNGYESTTKMKKLDFNVGAKYYFNNIISEKVSIYASIGIGKQFAFSTEDYKVLYLTPVSGVIDENNRDDFESDINSPFHFNFGFGAEYFLNESLSLNSNIRVIYSSASGNYKSRFIDQYYTRTSEEEINVSDFTTKIGLGLNFYF